ncbi:AraC family transcriptional regulator [Salinisphaera sp. S4-8]
MRILVFGATGHVGRTILAEACDRGHQVTGVARSKPDTGLPGATYTCVDISTQPERAAALATKHDVLITALRPAPGREHALVRMTRTVVTIAGRTGRAVYVVGGAANLRLATNSPGTVLSTPGFLPDSVRPIASACAELETVLMDTPDVNWLCLRPAPLLFAGARSGRYAFGSDVAIADRDGASRICYADFAAAMLDLVEAGKTSRRFVTVGQVEHGDQPADRHA